MKRRTAAVLGGVMMLIGWPCAAQDTAVFLSVRQANDPESLYFWWRDDVPQLGGDQEAILAGLSNGGVKTVQPTDLSRISKVFRQPSLTESNAANLARLIGAQRIVVGEIVVGQGEPLGPLRIPEQKLEVSTTVVDVGAGGVKASRLPALHVTTFDSAATTPYVRLGEELARWLREPEKATHVDAPVVRDEPLLVISRNVDGATLALLRGRIAGHPNLTVRAAWANDRYLALEVNPGQPDSVESIEATMQAVFKAPFEGFFVKSARSEAVPNALELTVEMAPIAQ